MLITGSAISSGLVEEAVAAGGLTPEAVAAGGLEPVAVASLVGPPSGLIAAWVIGAIANASADAIAITTMF